MINFEAELEHILANDPLGLLNSKPKAAAITSDDRLVASFEEVNKFIETNGREPEQSNEIIERRLFSRLRALRESPAKALALAGKDRHGLLAEVELPRDLNEIQSVDDILSDDVLGVLDSGAEDDPEDIFTLKNVPTDVTIPDHIAQRKPCRNFEQFEPLFKEVHAGLASGRLVTRPFNSERQIKPGEYFICQGMLVYVANQGKWEKKNFGNVNARLYCVFENETESNMFLRSLAAALWKDEFSRQVIEANQQQLFQLPEGITPEDKPTGFIYVLRSLSDDPGIKKVQNLFKVGYSSGPVDKRIRDAKKDSTYLFADVEVVAEYQTINVDPQKFELLLHKVFGHACLDVDVHDPSGRRYTPREWFVAPLHVIQQAIQYILSEEILQFEFDPERQEIVRRRSGEKEK